MTNSTKTVSIASTVAAQLAAEADMVSSVYFGLPQEDFIVQFGKTSNQKDCVILTGDDANLGALKLHNNVKPEALMDLLPEGVYIYNSSTDSHTLVIEQERVEVPFIAFTTVKSDLSPTPFSFFLANPSTVRTKLSLSGSKLNSMVFPLQKEKLSREEVAFSTAYNNGNLGVAIANAAKSQKKGFAAALAGFFN
jgi:hypothetical protein